MASIVVVGAGLAGMTCAIDLMHQGHNVVVLEASDGVGGRVRSDVVSGYILDRGFQVLFEAYPSIKRRRELAALQLRPFDPGFIMSSQGKHYHLADPKRSSARDLLNSLLSTNIGLRDKLRLLKLARQVRSRSIDELMQGEDLTTLAYLQHCGFSSAIIESLFRPLYGGIFLDRSLHTSSKMFLFTFKMLIEGLAYLPVNGMGELSKLLAEPLEREGCIRLETRVVELLQEAEQVVGVRLEDGSTLRGDAVVLATTADEAARLSGLPTLSGALQHVTVYLSGAVPLYNEKKILLNTHPEGFINNLQMVSNVVRSYAAPKRHLLSAMILGSPPASDEELYARTFGDLRQIFAGNKRVLRALHGYAPLAIYRINYAQFPQPPGIHTRLPNNRSARRGLYFAGEFTIASNLNAAIESGERCAQVILEDFAKHPSA
jgi:Phytoene dehydrogenase and related proteins